MLAGAFTRRPRSVSWITSAATWRRPPSWGKASTETLASIPSTAEGSGNRRIPREGWRSRSPARVSTAASRHSAGTQARWVMTLVRRSGPSVS